MEKVREDKTSVARRSHRDRAVRTAASRGSAGAAETKVAGTYDIVIVGSGPAGCSTALHLAGKSPDLAGRTLVIESAHHPRPKLCGGGLTRTSQRLLQDLGLELDVPFQRVNTVALRYRGREFRLHEPNVILVVRRDEFDASLAASVRERGVELREGIEFNTLDRDTEPGWVLLHTTAGVLRTRCVVGADGARSTVRRHIGLDGPSRIARAIEILTPEDPSSAPEFTEEMAVFDVSNVPDGLQGYIWDFPSRVGGEARMNRGACDFRLRPERPMAPMKELFEKYLLDKEIDLRQHKLSGSPFRWYDPAARISAPGVLVVGDAAGIEPLVADGISTSLWYGDVASDELIESAAREDWTFSGYTRRVAQAQLGRYLTSRLRAARFFYGVRHPAALRLVWTLLGWYLPGRARKRAAAEGRSA